MKVQIKKSDDGLYEVQLPDGVKKWFYTKEEANHFASKPRYEFKISPTRNIRIMLQYNDNGYGMGINNLINWNTQRPGIMSARVSVYFLDSVVDTPIGGISSWDIDKSYKTKTITFKTYDEFVKISREVESKMLKYFSRSKETV